MAFTVRDFESLVRLLDRHPEWLEALRQRLLTRELLHAPETLRAIEGTLRTLGETVAALAEAQRRHYEEFVAYRAETDRRFAELAEAQRRTEERLEQLAEAQRRTEEEIRSLTQAQRAMQDTLKDFSQTLRALQSAMDRFGQAIGPAVEERMARALRDWVKEQGGTLLGVIVSIALDGIGEVDGVVPVRFQDGKEGWILVSAKGKAWPRTIREFVEGILQNPGARAGLRAAGVGEKVWPVVFALAADRRALEAAQAAGVGLLLSGQGMVVLPDLWSLEEGAPQSR